MKLRNEILLTVVLMVMTMGAVAAECVRSAAVKLDTANIGSEIMLQTSDAMAYSLNWGSEQAAKALVTADGVPETETGSVTGYGVFTGTNTGNLCTFTWDYAAVEPAVLPRGSYVLTHTTYDSDDTELDTLTCSVKLLPEPCWLGLVMGLVCGLVRTYCRRRG